MSVCLGFIAYQMWTRYQLQYSKRLATFDHRETVVNKVTRGRHLSGQIVHQRELLSLILVVVSEKFNDQPRQ